MARRPQLPVSLLEKQCECSREHQRVCRENPECRPSYCRFSVRQVRQARKKVLVTVVALNGERRKLHYQAPAGKILTEAGIDGFLEKVSRELQEANPAKEFRLVSLMNGDFNICEVKPEAVTAPDA